MNITYNAAAFARLTTTPHTLSVRVLSDTCCVPQPLLLSTFSATYSINYLATLA